MASASVPGNLSEVQGDERSRSRSAQQCTSETGIEPHRDGRPVQQHQTFLGII